MRDLLRFRAAYQQKYYAEKMRWGDEGLANAIERNPVAFEDTRLGHDDTTVMVVFAQNTQGNVIRVGAYHLGDHNTWYEIPNPPYEEPADVHFDRLSERIHADATAEEAAGLTGHVLYEQDPNEGVPDDEKGEYPQIILTNGAEHTVGDREDEM